MTKQLVKKESAVSEFEKHIKIVDRHIARIEKQIQKNAKTIKSDDSDENIILETNDITKAVEDVLNRKKNGKVRKVTVTDIIKNKATLEEKEKYYRDLKTELEKKRDKEKKKEEKERAKEAAKEERRQEKEQDKLDREQERLERMQERLEKKRKLQERWKKSSLNFPEVIKNRQEEQRLREEEQRLLEEEQRRKEEEEEYKKELEYVHRAIDPILEELNYDFGNAETVLQQHKEKMQRKFEECVAESYEKNETLDRLIKLLNSEFVEWLDGYDDIFSNGITTEYTEECRQYLDKKYNVTQEAYTKIFSKVLKELCIEVISGKRAFLNELDSLTKFDDVRIKRNICSNFYMSLRRYCNESDNLVNKELKRIISEYMEFYDYGKMLANYKLNELTTVTKRRIDMNKYYNALKYFYETDNLEDIERIREEEERIRKEEKYFSNYERGEKGEKRVDYELSKLSSDKYYNVPKISTKGHGKKCIYIKGNSSDAERQEFDNVVVGPQGIFLLEVKDIRGEIEIDKYGHWRAYREDGKIKPINDPTSQVRRHEDVIKSIVDKTKIINIICLANQNGDIKEESIDNFKVNEANKGIYIVKHTSLRNFIEGYKADEELSKEEVEVVYNMIMTHVLD